MPRQEATRRRIAAIALDLLERGGVEAVTMRCVAAAAGITPMAIYHHFPNRAALLDAVTNAEFASLAEYFCERDERNQGRPFEDRFVFGFDGYLDYALAHPRVFDYVFSQPRGNARRFPADFRARKSPTLTPIHDRLAQAMREGRLKRSDAWEIAFQVWALVHGYVALYRGGRIGLREAGFRQLVHRALRRFLHGIQA